MVGRLAKDEEIKGFEDYGRTAVFINKPGDIQYKIKSLSTKNDVAEEQFTGYISSIRNLEFVDDQYSAPEDRVKAFSDFYSKSLFVFSHKIDSMGNVKVDVADVLTRPLVQFLVFLGKRSVIKSMQMVAGPYLENMITLGSSFSV